MNVKALAFGVLGLTVSATLTAMWVGNDMNEISKANDAKLRKECNALLASVQSGQTAENAPANATEAQKLAKRCETVGVSLTAVAPAGSSKAEVAAAMQSQTLQEGQDTVSGAAGSPAGQPTAAAEANGVLAQPLQARQPELTPATAQQQAAAEEKILENKPDTVPADAPPSFYGEPKAPQNSTNDPNGTTVELPR